MITNVMDSVPTSAAAHDCGRLPERRLSATIIETVRLTGISRSEIYRLLGEGKLRGFKAGSRTLLDWSSVEAHVNSLPLATFRSKSQAT